MKDQIILIIKWILYFTVFIPLLCIISYYIGFKIFGPLIYDLFN
jgi:hypothetical protein